MTIFRLRNYATRTRLATSIQVISYWKQRHVAAKSENHYNAVTARAEAAISLQFAEKALEAPLHKLIQMTPLAFCRGFLVLTP